jgi:hypothetical protein
VIAAFFVSVWQMAQEEFRDEPEPPKDADTAS